MKFNRCVGPFIPQILLIWKYLHGLQAYLAQQGKVAEWTEVGQSAIVLRK